MAVSAVDVEANLTAMAKGNSEDLDWKRSIVDLLKLVGMDSSFGARKELALELGYSQADIDSKGSAEMNMWLHKQVMKKLAENGGTVATNRKPGLLRFNYAFMHLAGYTEDMYNVEFKKPEPISRKGDRLFFGAPITRANLGGARVCCNCGAVNQFSHGAPTKRCAPSLSPRRGSKPYRKTRD